MVPRPTRAEIPSPIKSSGPPSSASVVNAFSPPFNISSAMFSPSPSVVVGAGGFGSGFGASFTGLSPLSFVRSFPFLGLAGWSLGWSPPIKSFCCPLAGGVLWSNTC